MQKQALEKCLSRLVANFSTSESFPLSEDPQNPSQTKKSIFEKEQMKTNSPPLHVDEGKKKKRNIGIEEEKSPTQEEEASRSSIQIEEDEEEEEKETVWGL